MMKYAEAVLYIVANMIAVLLLVMCVNAAPSKAEVKEEALDFIEAAYEVAENDTEVELFFM